MCTKVVLLPGSVVSAGPCPCGPHRAPCEPDGKLTAAQDMASFVHSPPSLKRVMLSVFEWTAFFFVRSIKTEGKVSQHVA